MNCIIDRGNTKTKIYFFEGNSLKDTYHALNEDEDELKAFLSKYPFQQGILSSSSDLPIFLNLKNILVLNSNTPIPIQLNYTTQETLGTDRIALAVGAQYLYSGENCLVISLGTCFTIDFIDQEGIFQGGIISPGLDMRLKAMHDYTANLPLLSLNNNLNFSLIGKSTKESMESGVYNGAIAEIDLTINRFTTIYKDLTAIITGGDHKLFELHLKNKIFAQQNLQAIGLNRILLHNAR